MHRPELLRCQTGRAVKTKVAAKPELVQISTAYKQPKGEKALPRNKYVEIREEKPDTPEKAKWPEFKTCKYTTETIVSDGIDKGELRKICTEPLAGYTIPRSRHRRLMAASRAEQEKRRREEALANATGIRVLQSIVAAVPVRLMKRDLLFIVEQLLPLLDEKRIELAARNRSIKAKEGESPAKLLTAFVRKADQGSVGKLIIDCGWRQDAQRRSSGLRHRYQCRRSQGEAGFRDEIEGERGHKARVETKCEDEASRLGLRDSSDLPSGRPVS